MWCALQSIRFGGRDSHCSVIDWLLLATLVLAGEDQGDAHYLYENTGAFPFLRANNKAVRRCLLALQAWHWHAAPQRGCLLFALLLQPRTGSGVTTAISHVFARVAQQVPACRLQSLAVICTSPPCRMSAPGWRGIIFSVSTSLAVPYQPFARPPCRMSAPGWRASLSAARTGRACTDTGCRCAQLLCAVAARVDHLRINLAAQPPAAGAHLARFAWCAAAGGQRSGSLVPALRFFLCTRHEHVMWLGRSSRWPLVSTPQDAVPQDPNQVRLPKFVAHK